MSSVGMPSVMQMIRFDLGVGGRFHDGVGSEWRRHKNHGSVGVGLVRCPRATVLKMGQPSCVVPPLLGVDSSDDLGYRRRRWVLAWKRGLPGQSGPCTITRVFLSTRIDIKSTSLRGATLSPLP